MKIFIVITFLFFSKQAACTNYYFANSGDDANSGTSNNSPWKSLSKLNSVTLHPGDSVLLKCGDVFYGSIAINQSGSASAPVTIGHYGEGSSPEITGFRTVAAWTNLGNNIWESANAVSNLPTLYMVVVNGKNTGMGRTPNTGYFVYQSHSGANSLASSSLNSAQTDWTGADVVVKKHNEYNDRCHIVSHLGNTLNFTDAGNPRSTPTDGYGFFIENDVRTLDAQNEWYYNPTTKKIDFYSTRMPRDVKIATIDNLIFSKSNSYIVIDGVTLSGGNNDGINFSGTTDNITIQNCRIRFIGNRGIEYNGGIHLNVTSNDIDQCGKTGIYVLGNNGSITHNTINHSSLIEGQSDLGTQSDGIYSDNKNGTIAYNVIKNSGGNGIFYRSQSYTIQYNLIDSSNLINTDNGGIYSGGPGINRLIDHNLVFHTIGDLDGTTRKTSSSEGIYLDEGCSNTYVTNNTAAFNGDAGLKVHSTGSGPVNSNSNRIEYNTFFDNAQCQVSFQNTNSASAMAQDTFRYNVLFSKTARQHTLFINDQHNMIAGLGVFDNNYYVRPIDNTNIIQTQTTEYSKKTLSDWQNTSGFDTHSFVTPKTITDPGDIRFEYNASPSSKTIPLDGSYIDSKGKSYSGRLTLDPYSSIVLLKN